MNQPPIRKHDLWKHQCAGYWFSQPKEASLLAMGLGTGKSATAIALAENWNCRRTLVLCPTTCRAVWRRELARHARREMNVVVLDKGSVTKRTNIASNAICDQWSNVLPLVVVVNYEATLHEPMHSFVTQNRWDLAILDESQRVMRESRTALICNEIRKVSKRRLCLTGTPLTQDPISVWAQCRFLDPTVFGENLDEFKEHFENPYAVGARKAVAKLNAKWAKIGIPPWKPPEKFLRGTVNTREYLERLSRIAFRVENAVLDLPPLTVERRTFRLSVSARSMYDAIQNGYTHEIETGRWPDVRGSYAITMRLQQITSGFLPDEDGKIVQVDKGKAECLADILNEAGSEPVVVFCRFVRDLDTTRQIASKLCLRYGEISQRRKDGINDLATMTEGLQVVGVQEASGGSGIDLTASRIAVRYSPGWGVKEYDQSIARLHRPPATKPVLVIELVAEETIDEEVYRAIHARKAIIKQVWSGLETVS